MSLLAIAFIVYGMHEATLRLCVLCYSYVLLLREFQLCGQT